MAEPTPGPRRAVAALLGPVGSFLSIFTVLSNLLVAAGLTATILPVPPRTLRPLIEPSGASFRPSDYRWSGAT
jgi:hypothetical protein